MTLNRELMSVSGPAWNPSTATPLPQLLPDSSGTDPAGDAVTPGSARSASSTRSKSCLVRDRRVAVQFGRDREHDDVVGLQPQLHAADVRQALREESRRDEQRHRERDLRRRERRPESRGRARARRLTGRPLERRDEIGPGAVQRRKQAEEQTGAERERGREQHRDRVEPRRDRVDGLLRQDRGHQVQRPLRDEEAADAAEDGEQARLAEQLPDQLPAAGADRQAHGHLARPRRGSAPAAGSRCWRRRSAGRTPSRRAAASAALARCSTRRSARARRAPSAASSP